MEQGNRLGLLFEDYTRTDGTKRRYDEGEIAFLERAAQPGAVKTRELLNQWFESYPEEGQDKLKGKLKAGKDPIAAFYELFIHELFRRQGFKLTPHPKLSKTTKQPDFLVEGEDAQFLVEARVFNDRSADQVGEENVRDRIKKEIEQRVVHLDFFLFPLQIEIEGGGKEPSIKGVVRSLEEEAAKHDPDQSTEKLDRGDLEHKEELTVEYVDRGGRLKFALIPKPRQLREIGSNTAIGIDASGKAEFEEEFKKGLKRTLERKAKKYGKPGIPYILCCNVLSSTFPLIERNTEVLEEVLYDRPEYWPKSEKGEHYGGAKDQDTGLFGLLSSPSKQALNGVLFTEVTPTFLRNPSHLLYPHPLPEESFDLSTLGLSWKELPNGTLVDRKGYAISELLGLSDDWIDPVEEFRPIQ